MKEQEAFIHELVNLIMKSKFYIDKLENDLLLSPEEKEEFRILSENTDKIMQLTVKQRG